ncbi:MAG: Fic family protein [Bacteroidota bacterium]
MKKPPIPPDTSGVDKQLVIRLFEDAEVLEFLNDVNSKYVPWSKFKYLRLPSGGDQVTVWAAAKLMRKFNRLSFSIKGDHPIEFSVAQNERIQRQLHLFDMNIGGNLAGKTIIPSEDKDRYLISSIMEEAIASSQLEGAVTSREVAKEMLRKERKPRNKSEKMILNNYVTIQKILEWKGRKITKDSILELHAIVTRETLENPAYAGRFRDNNEVNVVDNQTHEILHRPPSFTAIDSLMDSFCKLANDRKEATFIHPIIKASILHFLIGYIHPFVDGNGRTARAIFYWFLIKNGYWLMEYMSISSIIKRAPVQYAKAYLETEQDDNDLTYFIMYMLRTMNLAFKNLKDYINRKVQEKQNLYELSKINGINDRQAIVLRKLLDKPTTMLTIKEVQNTFGVVYQTARSDLLGLLEMGLVKKKIEGKKKLVFYRAKGFRKTLQALFSENE